jgi:tetratricopeptide (TPR) repeat protein
VALIASGFGCALLAALGRRSTAAAPALLLLGTVAAQERFTLRPEAASFFLLGLLLLILSRRAEAPRALLLLPPLFALWANVHALFAAGLGALVLVLSGDACDVALARRRGRAAQGEARAAVRLLVLTGVSALATLLTPYGLSAWALPRTLLLERIAGDNVVGRSIAEFQAPFSGFGRTASVAAFGLLAAIMVAGVAFAWRSCRSSDLLLLAAFLALALLARRNIALFSLVALAAGVPAVAAAWDRLREVIQRRRPSAGRLLAGAGPLLAGLVCVASVGLMTDVVSNRFYARDGTQRFFGLGIAPGFYPEGAADFVARANPHGEIFNDLTMGGYLAWRLHPARRLFIDGRLEVHDATLFAAYLAAQQDPRQFDRLVERYGIRTVVWSHRNALEAGPLLLHLAGGQEWRLAFLDLAAAVFTRVEPGDPADGSGGSPLDRPDTVPRLLEEAARAELRARADDPLPGWLRRVCPRVEVPAAEVGAAIFLALVGRPAQAEPLLRDAVRRAPWSAHLQYDLGLVLAQQGRRAEAVRAFEAARDLDAGLAEAGAALALLRLRAGDEEGALRDLDRLESGGSSLPAAALQARGALLARRGRIDQAMADYREAIRLDPGRASWRAELALLLIDHGLPQQALSEIDQALALDPEGCVTRVAAARVRGAVGDPVAAEEMLRAAGRGGVPCALAYVELARLLLGAGRRAEAGQAAAEALRQGVSRETLASDPGLRDLLPGS